MELVDLEMKSSYQDAVIVESISRRRSGELWSWDVLQGVKEKSLDNDNDNASKANDGQDQRERGIRGDCHIESWAKLWGIVNGAIPRLIYAPKQLPSRRYQWI